MNFSTHKKCQHFCNRLPLKNSKKYHILMRSSDPSQFAPKTEVTIFNPALSISSFTYHPPHNHSTQFPKGSFVSQSQTRGGSACRGRTPYESRKISQKQKANKILQNILAKNRQKHELQKSQEGWMKVHEVTPEKPLKKEEEKDDHQIRETDISLQQNGLEPFQRYSQQNNSIFDSNSMVNSWIFQSSYQHCSQNNKSNKKMVLKQFWKQKSQGIKTDLNSTISHNFGEPCKILNQNKAKEDGKDIVFRKGYLKKCQTQPTEDPWNQQTTSIHSTKQRKSSNMSKLLQRQTSSAIKIQPYFNQNYIEDSKKEPFCSNFSSSKIKSDNNLRPKICKHRSNRYLKTQNMNEQNYLKQVSAWEIPNDFQERETLS